MKKLLLTVAALLLSYGAVNANGYQVLLQGTRQTGMGNVGVGYRPNGSSIFFNPGALSLLDKSVVSVGGSYVMSKVAYAAPSYPDRGIYSDYTANTVSPAGTPFFAYAVYRPNEGTNIDKFAFGFGVYTPFGSTVEWEDNWAGQYSLRSISLRAIYTQYTVSYKVSDAISVGLGGNIIFGAANVRRAIPLNNQQGTSPEVELDGSAQVAYSFNAGVYITPSDKFSIGLNYRHGSNVSIENGTAYFKGIPTTPVVSSRFPNGTDFRATLPMPGVAAIGFGYYATEKLSFGVDVNYVMWSAYKSLRFDYASPVNGATFTENRRDYKDSWIFNFGTEFKATDKLTLRTGAYYDLSPVQDGYLTPETPDSNALGLTGGVSYQFSELFSIDAAFLYNDKVQRRDTGANSGGVDGYFKARGFIPSLALNFSF